MRPIIEVRGISKQYEIGAPRSRYGTLRESLTTWTRSPLERLRGLTGEKSTIWALKDVSFDVMPGEVVGVIGRNGAGKSTLLKVLSRITEPTEGEARLYGRIASLLEVGTGFHPELSGRENIYLNGAILGMRRVEIERKFDEIVAFAEMEKFLDTPVKHYSSGMYMRLAFTVAAHLDPEVLVIDEVLAVGDARFQEKCLGKMKETAGVGRTVLFVSHNMGAVRTLCRSAVMLDEGRVVEIGPTDRIVRRYLTGPTADHLESDRDVRSLKRTRGNGPIRITSVSLRNVSGEAVTEFGIWQPFVLTLSAASETEPAVGSFWVLVYSVQGDVVLSAFQYDVLEPQSISTEGVKASVTLDPVGLVPGRYFVSVGAFGRHNDFYDWIDGAITFDIKDEFNTGRAFDQRFGQFSLPYTWKVKPV